jgi:hypothetical protein
VSREADGQDRTFCPFVYYSPPQRDAGDDGREIFYVRQYVVCIALSLNCCVHGIIHTKTHTYFSKTVEFVF